MNAPAAIQGDYVDLRFIKSRKVCQVVIEIPIEAGETFVAAFGTPNPATGVPVALARINAQAAAALEKIKRNWDELSIAQQAGILCNEKRFQVFVGEQMALSRGAGFRQDLISEQDAAWYVRTQCGVNSRADIEKNHDAVRKFKTLDAGYRSWLTT